MKKFFGILVALGVLIGIVACKQEPEPPKAVEKVSYEIPIDVLKADGLKLRPVIKSVNVKAFEVDSVVQVYNVSIATSEEQALAAISPFKKDSVNVKYTETGVEGYNALVVEYEDLKKVFGDRDLVPSDTVYVAFIATSNRDAKYEEKTLVEITVGNPRSFESAELKYGYVLHKNGDLKNGWYLEATLNGEFPTMTADFYLGGDEKANKLNEKPVNGSAKNNMTKFCYLLPEGKVLLGQPLHIRLDFQDVEKNDIITATTQFVHVDAKYGAAPADIWGFKVGEIALSSSAREGVQLDTAAPKVEWDSIEPYSPFGAEIVNEEYRVKYWPKSNESDAKEVTTKNANPTEITLTGLQYATDYCVEVTYSFDIKGNYALERKKIVSPIVSFTTKNGDDAWGFKVGKIALSSAREGVQLDTADPTVEWASIRPSGAEIEHEEYRVKYWSKSDESDANEVTTKNANTKITLTGLKYATVYCVQVTYSYDIKGNYALGRKKIVSPIVSFTTKNGLESDKLYTFDPGRIIKGTLVDWVAEDGEFSAPADLKTNGSLETSGGKPSNALSLGSGKTLESASSNYYGKANLKFDLRLPENLNVLFETQTPDLFGYPYSTSKVSVVYKDDADNNIMAREQDILTFKAGAAEAKLVFVPAILESDETKTNTDDPTKKGTWNLKPAKLVLRVSNGDGTNDVEIFEGKDILKVDGSGKMTTDEVKDKLKKVGQLDVNYFKHYGVEVDFSREKILAKVGDKEASVNITTNKEKHVGYTNFTLTSDYGNLLLDNVKYTVPGGADNYIRAVQQ